MYVTDTPRVCIQPQPLIEVQRHFRHKYHNSLLVALANKHYSNLHLPQASVKMKFSIEMVMLVGLGLIRSAAAAKGKVEVQGCIWQATKPDKPYTVRFTGGSSSDACMKRKGNSPTMTVSEVGITCTSLGDVEADDDGWCYWQQSRWGMSYTVDGKPYSGSTLSRVTTGPVHSDIELNNQSPGTNVCASKAQCSSSFQEWRNSGNEPIYIVFKPGTVAQTEL